MFLLWTFSYSIHTFVTIQCCAYGLPPLSTPEQGDPRFSANSCRCTSNPTLQTRAGMRSRLAKILGTVLCA